jgi:cysteine desulfurase
MCAGGWNGTVAPSAYLNPNPNGLIPPERVAAALRPDTVLVSLMHVNNETGVVQDIAAIGQITRQYGILLHVDAAQSAGKLPLDLRTLPVDLLSLSAHKLYGPKGIGALYVRQRPNRVRLEPLLYGGGQERGLRAGTLPTHQIVAMGEACRIAG